MDRTIAHQSKPVRVRDRGAKPVPVSQDALIDLHVACEEVRRANAVTVEAVTLQQRSVVQLERAIAAVVDDANRRQGRRAA